MGKYIAEQRVKQLIAANKTVKGAKVIIFGITFKERLTMDSLKSHLSNNGNKGVIIDVKGLFDSDIFNDPDLSYWRL